MKAAIVGGTGYGAVELIRLINRHPSLEVGTIISSSHAGTKISDVYPQFNHIIEESMESFDADRIYENNSLVFLATPSGVSKDLVPPLMKKGMKCIDLSGDLRLKNADEYEKWYKKPAAETEYLNQAVYGLSEIYEDKVKNAALIANPGCFPTATLLGLLPIIKTNQADKGSIIIDAKSGVSGAGRSLSLSSHYAEINENIRAYKIGAHQHIPEIEQILGDENGTPVTVSFTTHVVPMTRGIMCTIYVNLNEKLSTADVIEQYKQFYRNKPFVRVRSEGNVPSTKEVLGSNYCDIGLYVDDRTRRLTIISVIDNLVKGASGQAIQNANLMNGWDVRTGLQDLPTYP